MADQRQVERLRAGVEGWNAWAAGIVDLREVDLSGVDLRGANLRGAVLRDADLRHSDLRFSDLQLADLSGCLICGSDLCKANLRGGSLRIANLLDAELRGANLIGADLTDANLLGAGFSESRFGWTSVTTDWERAKFTSEIVHSGPSTGALDASSRSRGTLPQSFLRGCGLEDWEVEFTKLHRSDLTGPQVTDIVYAIDRMRGLAPIHPRGVFISYSRNDSEFVDWLAGEFTANHVRYWRDTDHMIAGCPTSTTLVRDDN